jgi:hypothetical protein
LHSLWTKLVTKHTEGIFPLCLEAGKGQNTELKKPMWGWGNPAAPVGKAMYALPWRNPEKAETDSFTKRKAHF